MNTSMYQAVKYVPYQTTKNNNSCYFLSLIALLSIVSFILIVSNHSITLPVVALLRDVELSLAFSDFIRDYDKVYRDEKELQLRKKIFALNYRLIERLSEEYTTTTFKVNQFADLTDEEFEEQYLDAKGMNEKCTVAQEKTWNYLSPPIEINKDLEIDWVKKGKVPPVKNQEKHSSYWTFATMSILETIYAIRENKLHQFSEQLILDCCKRRLTRENSYGSKGNALIESDFVAEEFQYTMHNGVMLEKDYPYRSKDKVCKYDSTKTIFKPNAFINIKAGDVKEMEKIILTRSIAVSVAASHPTFKYYKSGILETNCPETPLNHGVVIVGAGSAHGMAYWLVRNSWGRNWGDQGYIRIARSTENYSTGVCGIASYPVYATYKE